MVAVIALVPPTVIQVTLLAMATVAIRTATAEPVLIPAVVVVDRYATEPPILIPEIVLIQADVVAPDTDLSEFNSIWNRADRTTVRPFSSKAGEMTSWPNEAN